MNCSKCYEPLENENYCQECGLEIQNIVYEEINKTNNIFYIHLTSYIKNFFIILKLEPTCDFVDFCLLIFDKIIETEGFKRAKTKNAIILCALSIYTNHSINIIELAKRINLSKKYLNTAEKLIYDLIQLNKLNIDKNVFLQNSSQIDKLIRFIPKKLPDIIIYQMNYLYNMYKSLSFQPNDIAIATILFILNLNNITDVLNFKIKPRVLNKIYDIFNKDTEKLQINGIIKLTPD